MVYEKEPVNKVPGSLKFNQLFNTDYAAPKVNNSEHSHNVKKGLYWSMYLGEYTIDWIYLWLFTE